MAKPPKDPTKPPSTAAAKPAARRAPRNTAAKPATRRAAAPPKPATATAAADLPKAEVASPAPARKPRAAKPRASTQRAAPSRPQAATATARAAITKVPVGAKAALDAVPGSARAWTIGAVVAAAGAGLAAFLTRGRIAKLLSREGHEPVDLLYPERDGPVNHGDSRAPEAFRPDMDAAMTPAEREALRPPAGLPVDRSS